MKTLKPINIAPKKINKRPFLLLEIMVAVFLILLCAVPTLQVFMNIYKEQAAVIRINQRDHLVHLIHARLVEQLYKHTIALEELLEGKKGAFTDSDINEILDRLNYEASYAFTIVNPKKLETQHKASKYLVQLIINIKDRSKKAPIAAQNLLGQSSSSDTTYDYLLYIDRGNKDKLKPSTDEERDSDEEEQTESPSDDNQDESDNSNSDDENRLNLQNSKGHL